MYEIAVFCPSSPKGLSTAPVACVGYGMLTSTLMGAILG